jgi:hypothetical protein
MAFTYQNVGLTYAAIFFSSYSLANTTLCLSFYACVLLCDTIQLVILDLQ